MAMNSLKEKKIYQSSFKPNLGNLASFLLIAFLAILVVVGAVPNYQNNSWSWRDIPEINLNKIKKVNETGLEIEGWKILEHEMINIDENKWLAQVIGQTPEKVALLLLRTQPYHKDYPEVEWTNLEIKQRWKTSFNTELNLTVNRKNQQETISTRFLRARIGRKTFAVVQWYAWPNGGDFRSEKWFFQDKIAQVNQKRLPWIAVSLQIPISPLSDLEEVREYAQSLAVEVQTAIEQNLFGNLN